MELKSFLILIGLAFLQVTNAANTDSLEIKSLELRTAKLEEKINKFGNLKFSGYIQADYQNVQKDAILNVGTPNKGSDGVNADGVVLPNSFNRIGIRRGRLKTTYSNLYGSAVFQMDFTESGLSFKDVYLTVNDLLFKSQSYLKLGIFDRPFGYEIVYSSANRETPERTRAFVTLFPNERDMGGQLTLQAPATSILNKFSLTAALISGSGIRKDVDNRKDFIGRLSMTNSVCNITYGAGASVYAGSVYQSTSKVYRVDGGRFMENNNPSNLGSYAARTYWGADAQFAISSLLGRTSLRAEAVGGKQPGTFKSSKSPNASNLPGTEGTSPVDTYIRPFLGYSLYFIQDILNSKHSVVMRYDMYDPNTGLNKNEIGVAGSFSGAADVSYNTWGFGYVYKMNQSVRLMAYYELINNEKCLNLKGYDLNRKDNVFTVRVQYKF